MNKGYKTLALDLLSGKSNTFNPLQVLFSTEEILILKNRYDFKLNDSLMLNPLALYNGLIASEAEVKLIETVNYKIIGNSRCELSIKLTGEEKDQNEKYELLKIVNKLNDVIEIQKELN